MQERYFPDLKTINGAYMFNYAWYGYKPKSNFFLDLSALTAVTGDYAFTYATSNSEIRRFRCGVV